MSPSQYKLIKAKTFSNFLLGIPNHAFLLKALVVGETKTVNGENFVVKMTPSGVPDWRKVKSGNTSKKDDDDDWGAIPAFLRRSKIK